MRRFNALVFDDYIQGTSAPVYTRTEIDATLGHFDQLTLQAVVDSGDVAGGSLDVTVEHCADGRNWVATTGSPVFTLSSIPAKDTITGAGQEATTVTHLAFVRLKLQLNGATRTVRARVFVTARDSAA